MYVHICKHVYGMMWYGGVCLCKMYKCMWSIYVLCGVFVYMYCTVYMCTVYMWYVVFVCCVCGMFVCMYAMLCVHVCLRYVCIVCDVRMWYCVWFM